MKTIKTEFANVKVTTMPITWKCKCGKEFSVEEYDQYNMQKVTCVCGLIGCVVGLRVGVFSADEIREMESRKASSD